LIVGATVGLLVYGALVLAPKGEGRALLRHCFSSPG